MMVFGDYAMAEECKINSSSAAWPLYVVGSLLTPFHSYLITSRCVTQHSGRPGQKKRLTIVRQCFSVPPRAKASIAGNTAFNWSLEFSPVGDGWKIARFEYTVEGRLE